MLCFQKRLSAYLTCNEQLLLFCARLEPVRPLAPDLWHKQAISPNTTAAEPVAREKSGRSAMSGPNNHVVVLFHSNALFKLQQVALAVQTVACVNMQLSKGKRFLDT